MIHIKNNRIKQLEMNYDGDVFEFKQKNNYDDEVTDKNNLAHLFSVVITYNTFWGISKTLYVSPTPHAMFNKSNGLILHGIFIDDDSGDELSKELNTRLTFWCMTNYSRLKKDKY